MIQNAGCTWRRLASLGSSRKIVSCYGKGANSGIALSSRKGGPSLYNVQQVRPMADRSAEHNVSCLLLPSRFPIPPRPHGLLAHCSFYGSISRKSRVAKSERIVTAPPTRTKRFWSDFVCNPVAVHVGQPDAQVRITATSSASSSSSRPSATSILVWSPSRLAKNAYRGIDGEKGSSGTTQWARGEHRPIGYPLHHHFLSCKRAATATDFSFLTMAAGFRSSSSSFRHFHYRRPFSSIQASFLELGLVWLLERGRRRRGYKDEPAKFHAAVVVVVRGGGVLLRFHSCCCSQRRVVSTIIQ
jgi:hypothetical protein